MTAAADALRELLRTVENIYTSRFTSGAAVTLVLYDWALVFSQEFDTIYRSKWTPAKFLFCFVRFITPPGVIIGTMRWLTSIWHRDKGAELYVLQSSSISNLLSLMRCAFAAIFLTFGMICSVFASHGLFALRLIALYKGKMYLVWFITTFYLLTYILTFALAIVSVVQLSQYELFYSELVHTCVNLGTTTFVKPIWYAPVAFETFIFGLTAYRAWYDANVITGTSGAPLLVLFYRDGMVAFIVMTGMRIWNIWVYLTQPLSSLYVGTMLMWAISTVLTTRVYMNLVWLFRKPVQVTGMSTSAGIDTAPSSQRVTFGVQKNRPSTSVTRRVPNFWTTKSSDSRFEMEDIQSSLENDPVHMDSDGQVVKPEIP